MAEKFLNLTGLEQVWAQVVALLAEKYGATEVSSAINSALVNYYKKNETLSSEQIQTLINNLNAIKILNKSSVNSGILESTIADVDTTCDTYVQTNYSRVPQDFDGLLVTLTDGDGDIVLYVYSSSSASWIDASRNITIKISSATESVAGIAKLYNSLGTQTDGGITPQAVKTKTDSIESSISTLDTGKANVSDVYKKTETYSKTEVDAKVPAALTTEEIASIIGSAS